LLWPADKVERWPIDRLVPYARNARTHSDEQVAQVAASIREWGWTNPVLVGEDGGIIAGHARVLAGRKLGLAEVPVMLAAGWSEAQKRAYVLADNQLALNAGWNPELLQFELGELKGVDFDIGMIGFSADELASYGIGVDEVPMPFLSDAGRPSFQQMTFTLHDSQVAVIQAAITMAKAAGPFDGPNENSNGNALARICEAYSER
jgi:ParB/Sulfiredoxin domain